MSPKDRNCCYMFCGVLILLFLLAMTNTTGTPQPYVEGMTQNNMNNHNMNNLQNSNNTEMDTDLSMINNTHSNQVAAASFCDLNKTKFRELKESTDSSIDFFKDVKFSSTCKSNYSSSNGMACLSNSHMQELRNRGQKNQASV